MPACSTGGHAAASAGKGEAGTIVGIDGVGQVERRFTESLPIFRLVVH